MRISNVYKEVARQSNFTQSEVKEIGNMMFDYIKEVVSNGDKVTIENFGTFDPKRYEAKSYYNPKMLAYDFLEPRVVPKFIAAKYFKELCKNPEVK